MTTYNYLKEDANLSDDDIMEILELSESSLLDATKTLRYKVADKMGFIHLLTAARTIHNLRGEFGLTDKTSNIINGTRHKQ